MEILRVHNSVMIGIMTAIVVNVIEVEWLIYLMV